MVSVGTQLLYKYEEYKYELIFIEFLLSNLISELLKLQSEYVKVNKGREI